MRGHFVRSALVTVGCVSVVLNCVWNLVVFGSVRTLYTTETYQVSVLESRVSYLSIYFALRVYVYKTMLLMGGGGACGMHGTASALDCISGLLLVFHQNFAKIMIKSFHSVLLEGQGEDIQVNVRKECKP